MNSPALKAMTHVDIGTIAEALGISKRGSEIRANRETWSFDEQPCNGGKKRLYPLATLPKSVRESIACQQIKGDAVPLPVKLKKSAPTLTYPVAPLDPAHCTTKQREEEQARRVVLRKLDELQHAAGSSREAAMITMLTMASAGTLSDALCATLRNALDARGRKGGEYPSVRSLKRWIAKDKAGDLMPKIIQSGLYRHVCTIVHPKEVGNSQANGICENFNTSYLQKN
jgi:putative transposase